MESLHDLILSFHNSAELSREHAAQDGTAATHTENCEDMIHVRAVIRS